MIGTVKQREALAPAREPYWVKLANGRHLGFRKIDKTRGTWIARAYDPATQSRTFRALGDFPNVTDAKAFDAASKAANEWFAHLDGGGNNETQTVKQACAEYVSLLLEGDGKNKKPRPIAAHHAALFFARHVDDDPIANVELLLLRERHVEDWRKRLAKSTTRGKGTKSDSTINRDLSPMRAALNLAHKRGFVTSKAAWLDALERIAGADQSRDFYLDRDERRDVLSNVDDESRPFFRALCLLPLRPGALAAALVRDFDAKRETLFVRKDKVAAGRTIPLSPEAVKLFKEVSRLRHVDAPLFPRADGSEWTSDGWRYPIDAVRSRLNLPAEFCCYSFRHSTIADLVSSGLDLFTVAKLAGTSIEMIEKHYGKLRATDARDALAKLAL